VQRRCLGGSFGVPWAPGGLGILAPKLVDVLQPNQQGCNSKTGFPHEGSIALYSILLVILLVILLAILLVMIYSFWGAPRRNNKVRNDIMGCFDVAPGEKFNFGVVRDKLIAVQASKRVRAMDKADQEEVEGISDHMSNLAADKPPLDRDMGKLTPLTRECYKRAEEAYIYEFVAVVAPGQSASSADGTKEVLVGGPALMKLFEDVSVRMQGSDTTVDLHTLRPFKTYRWLLSEAQRTTVKEWNQTVAKNISSGTLHKAVLDASPHEDLALVAVKASSASTSSTSGGIGAKAAALEPLTKLGKLKAGKAQASSTHIMTFFFEAHQEGEASLSGASPLRLFLRCHCLCGAFFVEDATRYQYSMGQDSESTDTFTIQ
jgi:hypothetical protein